MAFATYADVETRLGHALSADQEAQAAAVIAMVEGLIVEVSGEADPSPAPAYYKALCVEKALNVISRPEPAVAAESLGAHSVTYSRDSDSFDVFLTEREEMMVRRIANNAVSGSSYPDSMAHAFVTEPA